MHTIDDNLSLLKDEMKIQIDLDEVIYENSRGYTLKDLDVMLEKYPNDINVLIVKMGLLMNMKYYSDALKVCEFILVIKPQNIAAMSNMGILMCLKTMGKIDIEIPPTLLQSPLGVHPSAMRFAMSDGPTYHTDNELTFSSSESMDDGTPEYGLNKFPKS